MQPENHKLAGEDAIWPESDEVAGILAALKALMEEASSPVVRGCLEEARDDIAHLTGMEAVASEGDADAA
jgi:hypothetical protein